jgi:putative SOS response-associated peptidase YedK
MCGRYTVTMRGFAEYQRYMRRQGTPIVESFNVAPTQKVPVIRNSPEGGSLDTMRWGLIPFFARGVPPKYSTINARIETVQTAASYRGPWKRGQRCLQLATGFYEWQTQPDGKTKIPYYITLNDQEMFALAGLWDSSRTDAGESIESCVHITMPANKLVGEIHNTKHRMPAILARDDQEAWLSGSPDEAWATLKPYPDEHMVAWPVSKNVNSPRNNNATLVEPVASSDASAAAVEIDED